MAKQKMLFGTAGIPISSKKRDSVNGIKRVKELGLEAMELEFVRGVNMGKETAGLVKKAAEKEEIMLSVHAPYYINLNSKEEAKVKASKKRIMDSAYIGELCNAKIVTFHPAYFQKMDEKHVLEKVADVLNEMTEEIEKKGWKIKLAPETTGKASQLGSLKETIALCKKVKGMLPMIDWSHLHARDNGRFKSEKDFEKAIEEIPENYRKFLYMHASGIRFGAKGERNHLEMEDEENSFNYKWFLKALFKEKVSGRIICESPNIERDALLMQKYWKKL